MTQEYTHEFFMYNGHVKKVDEFSYFYGEPLRYIYEVFRVTDGLPVFMHDHMDRVFHTCTLEHVVPPYTQNDLLSHICRLIRQNASVEGTVKIALIKADNNQIDTLIYYTPIQYPTADEYKHGVAIELYAAERINPNAKVLETLFRSETEQWKTDRHISELLLLDCNGYITEGSRSNIFFIKDMALITPPRESVLEGITRKKVLQICKKHKLTVTGSRVHQSMLSAMDAVFLTSTSRKLQPVNRIDDMGYEPSHPLFLQLARLFDECIEEYLESNRDIVQLSIPDSH